MKITRLILLNLTLLSLVFLCGCDDKNYIDVPVLDEKSETINENLINHFDEQINFNGKQTNISIFEYESYEREIKVEELSIKIPAKFVGFIYEKIVAEDLDKDNIQELLVHFNSIGSSDSKAVIILKVKDNAIFEIPLPICDDSLGLKADISFTNNYEVVVNLTDYSKTLKLKLDESLREILYTNGELNSGISKGIDSTSMIVIEMNLQGKCIIKIYQRIWAPVHVQRICDLVTEIKIDNDESEIVDSYLLK